MKSVPTSSLFCFQKKLLQADTLQEKIDLLLQEPTLARALASFPCLAQFFSEAPSYDVYLTASLIAIGQEHLLDGSNNPPISKKWLANLATGDRYYAREGGIVGYQSRIMRLFTQDFSCYEGDVEEPPLIDISCFDEETRQVSLRAIHELEKICLLLPVGGAADRLLLTDPNTGEDLPAGCLVFHGETLLEKLFLDIEGLEYLHYKIWRKTVRLPVVLMGSEEKNNARHIASILRSKNYFFRDPSTIILLVQPSVPVVDEQGTWCLKNCEELLVKPAGHGALWKLIWEQEIFAWLADRGIQKALVRQINNPASRYDYALSAFLGHGLRKNALFGVASCPRQVGAKEGVNVYKISSETGGHPHLSAIEYCDFARFSLEDHPRSSCSPYSRYPTNTNILWVDLPAAKRAVEKEEFPGMLLNFKELETYDSVSFAKKRVARLESTVQNISDQIAETTEGTCATFLTYHKRYKTISTTKRAWQKEGSFLETPERCYYDVLKSMQDLLAACHITHIKLLPFEDFLEKEIPFSLQHHPALGPWFSIIAQKMRYGTWAQGASARLDIAELDWSHVCLDGHVSLRAEQPTGDTRSGHFCYSENTGKCKLDNVFIENLGNKRSLGKEGWRMQNPQESLSIYLEGTGEFVARDISLRGDLSYRVPTGMRLSLIGDRKPQLERLHSVEESSWVYEICEKAKVRLMKKA